MTTSRRTLYQFPLSLYCEKTRWNLDYKQLDYRCRDLVPGLHLPLAHWLAGISTLPILREGRRAIGDSTRIALWLERQHPHHALLPATAVAREQVLALEGYFDELGDHVRRCVWSLAIDSANIDHVFYGFSGYSARARWLGRATTPLLRRMLRWRFQLQQARVADSWLRVTAALEHLEFLLAGDAHRHLVGDCFTLADLTGATMLAPLIGPAASPWSDQRLALRQSAEQNSARALLRQRVAGQWVCAMYARYRQPVHQS